MLTGEARQIVRRIRLQYGVAYGPARIYLLHFDAPFKHAKHYLGYTCHSDVNDRLQAHRRGHGSALIRALMAVGADFSLVLLFSIPLSRVRGIERRLKQNGSSARICPLCIAETRRLRNSVRRAKRHQQKEQSCTL